MFQTQLDDLDRIEALLESRLSPEHQATLRGEPAPEPEPSTFWDLADGITFELEIAPFPFTSHSASRLAGRLSRLAEQVVEGVVAEGLVDCRVRGADDDDQQPWTTMALTKSDKKWLRYELELHLPANQVTIELRFNNDNAPFDGEIGGWQIEVND